MDPREIQKNRFMARNMFFNPKELRLENGEIFQNIPVKKEELVARIEMLKKQIVALQDSQKTIEAILAELK
jgi:hypothetical protein